MQTFRARVLVALGPRREASVSPWSRAPAGPRLGDRRVVVVVGLYDWMGVNVDVAASTNAHSVNAGSFSEDVVVTPMVTFKILVPLTGGAKI